MFRIQFILTWAPRVFTYKAISFEPLRRFKCYLQFWNLCFETNKLSTFGDLYDPPFKRPEVISMKKISIFLFFYNFQGHTNF